MPTKTIKKATKKATKKAAQAKANVSEAELQKWILYAFEYDDNVWLFRRNVGAYKTEGGRFIRFAEKGQSDLWGIVKCHECPACGELQYGVHVEIEIKTDKGKLSKHQEDWLERMSEFNSIAIVVRPEEKDPIGLCERIKRIIYSIKCPKCS